MCTHCIYSVGGEFEVKKKKKGKKVFWIEVEEKINKNISNDTVVLITIQKFTLKTRHDSLFKIGSLRKDSGQ